MVEEEYGDRTVFLLHVIRWKGHFEQDWHEIYVPLDEYFALSLEDVSLKTEYSVYSYEGETFPPDAQIDFQVKARIGYVSRYAVPGTSGWAFNGETSDWSNVQTLNLSDGKVSGSISPNPSPTVPDNNSSAPTPTVPEFSLLTILPLCLLVLPVAFMLKRRKSPLSFFD